MKYALALIIYLICGCTANQMCEIRNGVDLELHRKAPTPCPKADK